MATRSWGWKKNSMLHHTGGRQATRIAVVGSQPHRPRPEARRNQINPTSRLSQLKNPNRRVASFTPAMTDHWVMACTAV